MLPSLLMGQPVKLSDEFLTEARAASFTMGRSIAGQVEFWAKAGMALERVASRVQMERLQQRASMPLSEIVATIDKPAGRARLQKSLENRNFPRFEAHPELARTFIRADVDGTRTVGRFRHGIFEPLQAGQG